METSQVARTIGSANELQLAFASDDAFRAWYDRTLPRVFGYLVARTGGDRELAEDLTAETYEAAIRQRHQFDGRSTSSTWLCAIARHKLADHYRRVDREGRRAAALRIREVVLDPEAATWQAVDDRELIATALRAVPATQRIALALRVMDGLSVGEIARLVGRSEPATHALITRGRDAFRRAYGMEVES